MIWLRCTSDSCAATALRRHLAGELTSLQPRREEARAVMAEIAAAVSAACASGRRATVFPTSLFWLLASQACWRVGERQAAEQCLSHSAGRWRHRSPLRVLMRQGCLTLPACSALSGGVISPRQTCLMPAVPEWRLDLWRLCGEDVRVLDALAAPRVRRALEQLAVLWDATGGRGVLLVRGPGGEGGTSWVDYAAAVLDRAAEGRGWPHRPVVVRDTAGGRAPRR